LIPLKRKVKRCKCSFNTFAPFRQKKYAGHTAQPHTLAAFLPWGSFAGASRPTRRKGTLIIKTKEIFVVFFEKLE
jgi:hypothetical protein